MRKRSRKTDIQSKFVVNVAAVALLTTLRAGVVQAADTWTDSTGNNLFSDPGNWSDGAPPNSFASISLPALSADKRQIDLGGLRIFSQLEFDFLPSAGDYRVFDGSVRTGSLTVRGGPLRMDANIIAPGGTLAINSGNGQSADLTLVGGIIGDGTGGGAFALDVEGATLLGSNTYTGQTRITEDPLKLQANGSIAGSPLLNLYGAQIILTNTASDNVNRIGDMATVALTQSELKLMGGTERIGSIQFGPAATGVVIQNSSGVSAKLRAASLARLGGSVVTVDNDPVTAAFVLDTPPALLGGGAGSTQLPILPWAISSTGSLMTYSGNGTASDAGLRALDPSTEYQTSIASAVSTSNVWLSGSTTVAGSASIGALVFGASSSVQLSGGTFTVNDAAVSVLSSGSLERSIFSGTGTLSFPGEAIFHVQPAQPDANISSPAKVVVDVPISAESLTKSGAGSLILARANDYPGGTRIVQGTVVCRADGALGTGSVLLSAGAGLALEQSLTLPGLVLQDEPTHISSDAPDATLTIPQGKTLTVLGDVVAENAGQDLQFSGGGTFRINGNVTGGEYRLASAIVVANGIWDAHTEFRNGTLSGNGTLHGFVEPNFINPGDGIGRVTIDNLQLGVVPGLVGMTFELAGNNAGVSYDQLALTNGISFGGGLQTSQLSLVVSAPLTLAEQFRIIDLRSSSSISGTFAGLPEGAVFTDDGYQFRITYVGGTGNDVVLTVVPEPGVAGLIALAASVALYRRRYKSCWNK